MRRGAILLFSLIVLSISVIVTGALSAYYVHTANVAKFYREARSSRRVGASRAVRTSMDKVMKKLETLAGSTQSTPEVGFNIQGKTMTEVLRALKAAVPASATIESERYDLKVETDELKNTLKITAMHGGMPIMSATIELESTESMSTLPVFDYVYFADNNGRLNSNYVIANGEVGSNGNFDLVGATVNGYLRYLNNVTVSGEPHAWLQGAYMAKIVTEFKQDDAAKNVIEQARPTNPALYEEGGTSKSTVWDGGYECVYGANPYSWTRGERPSPLPDPTDDEPQPPDPPQCAETSGSSQPSAGSSAWEDIDVD